MEISTNQIFRNLLIKYSLAEDLNFNIVLPIEVEQIISDKIIANEFGIANMNVPSPGTSYNEDFINHFHVNCYVQNGTEKDAFVLGIKTILELAERFQKADIKKVQLQYYFQTPEMAKAQFKDIVKEDDEYFINDRLSFHRKRDGEIVTTNDLFNTAYGAFLLIDV